MNPIVWVGIGVALWAALMTGILLFLRIGSIEDDALTGPEGTE